VEVVQSEVPGEGIEQPAAGAGMGLDLIGPQMRGPADQPASRVSVWLLSSSLLQCPRHQGRAHYLRSDAFGGFLVRGSLDMSDDVSPKTPRRTWPSPQ